RHTSRDRPVQLNHALKYAFEFVQVRQKAIETTLEFDKLFEKRIIAHAVLSSGSNSARSSSGGPRVPSDMRGVTRKLLRSRIQPVMILPGGPRFPSGPAMPRWPWRAISCQPAPGHGPGLSLRARNEPPSSTTMSPRA